MQATYEYIFAAIMIFVMLSATVTTMVPLLDVNLSQAREYQLELVADRVFNKILRTPGYPADWGTDPTINYSDTSSLKDFGLALASARSAYILDPNKVVKIENGSRVDNLYYVSPQVAAQLLGLGSDYGFALSILPVLNVTVTSVVDNNVYVYVTTQENIPAPNANVSALALWWESRKMFNATSNSTTDWRGECVLEYTVDLESKGEREEGMAMIMLVNYHGIRTVDVVGARQSLIGSVTGRYVTVVYPENESGSWKIEGDPLLVVYPYVFVGQIVNGSHGQAKWVINKGGKSHQTYELAWVDPYTNFIVLVARKQDVYSLVVVPRPWRIQYQTGPLAGLHRVTLHRLAVINGITHYVRLSIWRMSE